MILLSGSVTTSKVQSMERHQRRFVNDKENHERIIITHKNSKIIVQMSEGSRRTWSAEACLLILEPNMEKNILPLRLSFLQYPKFPELFSLYISKALPQLLWLFF